MRSLSEGVALTVRALLGYPTPRIDPLHESDPVFVKTLTNLISVLRPYWKCLNKMNESDESLPLSKYLADWDEKHRKSTQFFSYSNLPDKYPLTGFFPFYTEEDKKHLNILMDELIEKTDLSCPAKRTGILIENPEAEFKLDAKLLEECERIELDFNRSLLKAVDAIVIERNVIELIAAQINPY